ncbi:hypothetical protein P9F84_15810, partial [Bacillus subtilis]|uniref:hypothetical protein n=1 Tax=Bacillus subtilis TaxID=1423 RepID=UPI002DB94ABF
YLRTVTGSIPRCFATSFDDNLIPISITYHLVKRVRYSEGKALYLEPFKKKAVPFFYQVGTVFSLWGSANE